MPEKTELIIPSNIILALIGEKKYTVAFDDENGIFIQSDDGVKVTEQSKTGNWLYVK